MAVPRICPKCGSEKPVHSPGGLCPVCMLHEGLDGDSASLDRGSHDHTLDLPPMPGSVLESISATIGRVPHVLLRDTAVGEEPSPIIRPMNETDPTLRYRIDGEITRGGMGSVLRGRDPDIGRDVAIKVLREDLRENGDMVRRFVEEAQIGGQLQHPGVVPIYELGTFADKRPFFSMKLVKGQTLADLLASRPSPSDDLPRFLSIFAAIAQTMAYAHTRGVIHRDLKPSNMIVGSFGEVQVMDWGLAKVLPRGGVVDDAKAGKERPPETMIATARSGSDRDHSHAGSVLGTPSYLAPEQARGETDLINERADIFALGSILCEILTGSPAFTGRSSGEIVRKAGRGETAEALEKLDNCGAEAELIALARDCLAIEPEDRLHDANVVSERITAYLAGVQERLQTAERERAVAMVREAEERKRRKVQLALAASVALLLLGGGAVAWWQNVQAGARRETDLRRQLVDEQRAAADNSRLARNAEAVAGLLGQAEEALKAGDAAKAVVALEAAKKRSAEGGAEKEADRLKRLDADLALLRDLDAVDQFRWTVVANEIPDAAVVATRTREALKRFGVDPDAVSVDEAAARVSASVVRQRIVSALDRLLMPIRLVEWDKLSAEKPKVYTPQLRADVAAMLSNTAGVRALLRLADANPYRDAVRDAVIAEDRAKFVELAGQKAALEQPPGFVAFLGESQAIHTERRRQLLESAVSRRPWDLGLLMSLGNTYPANQKDGAQERLRWFQAAIAAAPADATAHNNLGLALADKGQLDAAIACYQKAIVLDPRYAWAHSNLGLALHNKGQLDAAIACYQKAIVLDPKLAIPHYNLGITLRDKGQADDAIACYKKAIELDPKLAAAHSNLGVALHDKGQWDAAIACYQKAIVLDPKFANAHNNLGGALHGKGQVDEAIAWYRKAIELDPKYAAAHSNLGIALNGKGQVDEAIASFKKAIELDPKLPNLATVLRNAQRMAAARDKLPLFLKGQFQPTTNDERLGLFEWCQTKKLNRTAAGLYDAASAADPELADDLRAGHRYNAACFAALAAAGQGEDAANLDDAERTRLRKQSLDWLRADLALRTKQLESGKPADRAEVQRMMLHWQKDTDLAGIRDTAALAKLPADEQKAFTQLWADVAELLQKVNAPPSLASLLQQLPEARKALPTDSPQLAGLLAQIGLGLLEQKKWSEAEPLLRECLAIREKTQPDEWSTFNTRSTLGGSLLGQKKYAEAESLIVSGYEGMKTREAKIPRPANRA